MKFYLGVLGILGIGLIFSFGRVRASITITVTTTADTIATDGACSMREAVTAANSNSDVNECLHDGSVGIDTIEFSIGTGFQSIALLSALPVIIDPVVIDGTSQPGFGGCGIDTPAIELNGTGAGGGVNGFYLDTDGNIIRGLTINRFQRDGILITSNNNTIQCNYLGADSTGTLAQGNLSGVAVSGNNNLIGGTNLGDGNLISGNTFSGIWMGNIAGGTPIPEDNIIQGNFIGTNFDGTAAIGGNPQGGIGIFFDSRGTLIGGQTPGAGNIISGNSGNGIGIVGTGGLSNTVIEGNRIGTDITGTLDLGNGENGLYLRTIDTALVGGTSPEARNLISGNDAGGIYILVNATNITVQGNYIGTDITGTLDIGNTTNGIGISFASSNNLIGGTVPGAGNLVSGNDADGIVVRRAGSDNNIIQGNRVGTDANGINPLPNTRDGIVLDLNPANTLIGGTLPGAGNLVSGNGRYGIFLAQGASNSLIQGNLIGTDINGTADLGNDLAGVSISYNISNNQLGGSSPEARNIISGNNYTGVWLGANSSNNRVEGNYIGTNITGTVPIPNARGLIISESSNNNIIGGASTASGNLISGNSTYGIGLYDLAHNNHIQYNFIGTNANGEVALGNGTHGLLIDDEAHDNLAEFNLISGNFDTGVYIEDPNTMNNRIFNNYIGSDISGAGALPNANGVSIRSSASANQIESNLITFNLESGILLNESSDSSIRLNRIWQNQEEGILLENAATIATNEQNCIMGNGQGFLNTTAVLSVAESNWWGAATGPSGVGGGAGDTVSANVDYQPWLTSANLGCPTIVPLTAPGTSPVVNVTSPQAELQKMGFLVGELEALWTITVSNNTGQMLTNLLVTDEIPQGWQITGFESSIGTISRNGQLISIAIPSLASGEATIIRIYTEIPQMENIRNTACLGATCVSAQLVQNLPLTGEVKQLYSFLPLLSCLAALGFVITAVYLIRCFGKWPSQD